MNTEKRKKARELSEEVRHNIVAEPGQSQGYKSTSRDLSCEMFPVSNVCNVINKFKARATVASLPGRGRELDGRLQRWTVIMLGNAPL